VAGAKRLLLLARERGKRSGRERGRGWIRRWEEWEEREEKGRKRAERNERLAIGPSGV